MNMFRRVISLSCFALTFTSCAKSATGGNNNNNDTATTTPVQSNVVAWLTDPDKSVLFQKQPALVYASANNSPVIEINDAQTFQTMDGFGYTLTGGSAMHIANMDAASRSALLKELFATDASNIGVSYLRISIGASDLDAKVFSYDDLPAGQTDESMDKFSIDPDKQYLIPVLKEILAISPAIKLLGSPWSAPAWMKNNSDTKGGSLKPEHYNAYAKYFVKYIQTMQAEGITVDAITIQNEPLNPDNNPSMVMQPAEQASFIKTALGPAFKAAGITTKIILYDHNCDRPDYVTTVLNDADANQYIDGSAFHLYAGDISALSQVHDAYPNKNVYFTEQWIGAPGNLKGDMGWHIKNVVIGSARNWSRTALEWNLAANSALEPHTPGGCTQCLGALTIDGNNVKRNPAYYVIAHIAKFVRPGAVRIGGNVINQLPNVAFKTSDGKKILLVLNEASSTQTFNIKNGDKTVTATLNSGAVATFIW